MNCFFRLKNVLVLSGITLISAQIAYAQFGKPLLVNFVNETNAPVQLVITSPVPEALGQLRVNEGLEVDFNPGEVVEVRQHGRVLKTITISQSKTERIRATAMNLPMAPMQNQGQNPRQNPVQNPTPQLPAGSGPPPPPAGMIAISNEEHEARELARLVNQIRSNPRSFSQLHQSLNDSDMQQMPTLTWNNALQKAAERKAAWIVQTGQSTPSMTINGQQVGMNQWMREAGYQLPSNIQNNATNFEVRFSANRQLNGLGQHAARTLISQGKDGPLARVLLGRSGWQPCTDIGAAVARDQQGTYHVVVLVGFQRVDAPSVADPVTDPGGQPVQMPAQAKLMVTNQSGQIVFVGTRTANTASSTPVLPNSPAEIAAEMGMTVTVKDFQGNLLRELVVAKAVETIILPAASMPITSTPGPPTQPNPPLNPQPETIPSTTPSPQDMVFIPSLENHKKDDAIKMLIQLGLKPNPKPGKKSPNPVFDNLVYQQSPAYLANMPPGTEVTFEYYFVKSLTPAKTETLAGPAPVPGVVNELKFHAEDVIAKAGFTPNSIPGERTLDDAKVGRVYSQDISPGSVRDRPSTVTIRYYMKNVQANQNVQVPDVTGMSRWDAEMRILQAGLAPKREDAGTARLPIELGMIERKGGFVQQPAPNAQASAGSTVTYKALHNLPAIGPYDADSPEPIPNLIPAVNADGSLDIAWTRRDGKAFYSRFSGNNWQQADHMPIPNALRYIAGMCKDEAGNSYLATMRQEYVHRADWDNFRPNVRVAELLKIQPGHRDAQVIANLNQKKFVWQAITNPLNVDSNAYTSSRMAYGSGSLFCAFGQNNAEKHSSVGMFGVSTSGASVYNGEAGQHPCEADVHFDGENFVMAQTFEAGLALTKLTPRNGTYKSSEMKLVFENEGFKRGATVQSFVRIGGIENTPSGYLILLTSSTAGHLWNYYPSEGVPTSQTPARLLALLVPRTFDTFKTFDWESVSQLPLAFPQTQIRQISNPTGGNSHVRPKLVDLGQGTFLVLSEERTPNQDYVSTLAMVIDSQGQVLRGPKSLPDCPLHMSNDAFRFPNGNAGWVSGDSMNNRINMFVIDSSLNVQKHVLTLPE